MTNSPTTLLDPGADDVLYIVDLHCFMYRFWATMQGRCAHGFADFVDGIIRAQQPAYFAVCTDLPFPTFRAQLYPKAEGGTGYKAHREPPDPTLLERLRWAREIVEDVYGAPVYGRKGFEADDLIAALTRSALEDGMRVVVLALDKDLTQLVSEHCVMWDGKKSVTGPAEVQARFGVRADQMRDYLAIVGDSSDNVPGVRGMGPEAAKELLAEFGTLEYAVKLANESYGHPFWTRRPRFRTMLREQRAQIDLSVKLVSLRFDAPIDYNPQEMAR